MAEKVAAVALVARASRQQRVIRWRRRRASMQVDMGGDGSGGEVVRVLGGAGGSSDSGGRLGG